MSKTTTRERLGNEQAVFCDECGLWILPGHECERIEWTYDAIRMMVRRCIGCAIALRLEDVGIGPIETRTAEQHLSALRSWAARRLLVCNDNRSCHDAKVTAATIHEMLRKIGDESR